MKRAFSFALVLTVAAVACNLSGANQAPTDTPAASPATALPTIEPTEPVAGPDEVCLSPEAGQVQFISRAGGYCFLLPDSFSASPSDPLDTFALGPTLASSGQERLALIVQFNVLGAPGGAGAHDPESFARSAIEQAASEAVLEPTMKPYLLGEMELPGVWVGPLPGMILGDVVFVRTNDTMYSITVHPDGEAYSDFADQVDQVWADLNQTVRFFAPVPDGTQYQTEAEVCPTEQDGAQLVMNLTEGWCALIPADWSEDQAFDFPGRFVGGPEIGEFWPGQPPYANIVIGFSGPSAGVSLEQRVEGRMNANGHPELVERTDSVVGGYQAVILDTKDGPVPERVALIQAGNYQYSVLGTPFDSAEYPQAQPALQAAWDLVIGSVQFFEPYQ